MKTFALSNLKIRNIRSIIDADISFTQNEGLKLLSGENVKEPRLGANGAGKSSVWDALYWCFYGVSIRGARTSQLVTYGQEQAEVTVVMYVGNQLTTIKRTGPPNKIFLNDKPVEQEKITELLGLSKVRFLHSVIFGQNIDLFPDLPTPERGALLDEVLDLGYWNKCSDAATLTVRESEGKVASLKNQLAFLEGKLAAIPTQIEAEAESLEWERNRERERVQFITLKNDFETKRVFNIECAQADVQVWDKERRNSIDALALRRDSWKDEQSKIINGKIDDIAKLEKEQAKLTEPTNPWPARILTIRETLNSASKKLLTHQQQRIESDLRRSDFQQLINKINTSSICDVCGSPLTHELKEHRLEYLAARITADGPNELLEATAKIVKNETDTLELAIKKNQQFESDILNIISNKQSLAERHAALTSEVDGLLSKIEMADDPYTEQITALTRQVNPHISIKLSHEVAVNPYIARLLDIDSSLNPFTAKIAKLQQERDDLQSKVTFTRANVDLFNKNLVAAEYWKHGFKRIRLYFVQQVMAALEIEIASALSSLGLQSWEVKLSTESENKSGSLKLGINITIASPDMKGNWEVWSGGETQRLRLAIAMGLASLIQRASGVWYGWEVWDEPTAGLSSEGIEDLLESLRYRAEAHGRAVWVVDHRALMFSGFREIWLVSKQEAGSVISMINESE